MTIRKITTICACLCVLEVFFDFTGSARYFTLGSGIITLSQDIALITIAIFFFTLRKQTNK